MRFGNMISAVDAHACGEPGRVIIGGVFDVPGKTMFEKKVYLETKADSLRKRMLREPRGYPALCCNLVLPAVHPDADIGFIVMEQTEYPPMSGSNTICVVTVLIETGIVPVQMPVTRLKLDTPAGLVEVEAEVSDRKVTRVTFRNVPSFAVHLDRAIEVRGLGSVVVDVAYGGMFYVIADADQFGLRLTPDEGRDTEISDVSISQLSAPATHPDADRKNAVVVSTGAFDWDRPQTWSASLDRWPCGTGTSARMAVLHAKGKLPLHRNFRA
jgi:proline racemase